MTEFLGRIYSWFAFIPKITFTNLVEILILTVLIYEMLVWVQNTRAVVLLKGGAVIFAFYMLASLFHLNTIIWIANNMGQLALIAVLLIFQPELRKALEQLGRKNLLTDFFVTESDQKRQGYTEKTVNEIVRAAFEMGKVKTGALIVIEKEDPLQDYERTGIDVDGLVTSQLLINIFEHNTPLHDGAVVIRGNRITAATCYLPLSENLSISKDLGTRHRAALGISESTDSMTVVVSEETGRVSLAENGTLRRMSHPDELREAITVVQKDEEAQVRFKFWKGRHRNEGKKK